MSPMTRYVQLAAALTAILCLSYLLTNPMERTTFFLTRQIGKMLFPRLDPYRQQQRTAFFAGLLLAVIGCAEIIAFVLKRFNRHS